MAVIVLRVRTFNEKSPRLFVRVGDESPPTTRVRCHLQEGMRAGKRTWQELERRVIAEDRESSRRARRVALQRTGETNDMNEEKNLQTDAHAKPPAQCQVAIVEPDAATNGQDVGRGVVSTSQVVRTVAFALLTAVVVLGALLLLWQVRTFIAWFVIALFLAAALNPAVNGCNGRDRLIKRPLAIVLSYLGLLAACWSTRSMV